MLNSTLADFEFDSSMDNNEECRAVEKSVLSSLSRMLSKGDIPLDSLTVSCNCLDDSMAIESIAPSLKLATKLKSVVLGSRNQLTAAGVNAISNAMQEHGGKINLCVKWSSDDVMWDMTNKCRGVESLTLERNEGNPNYKELESLTQEQIKGFSDNLIGAFSRRRSGISSLSLEGLRMSTHQFRYFVQALGRCSNLKDIRFDLSLDNGRADTIAEALLTSESLKAIGFGWNSRISDDEASALAALLKNNHHINQVRVDGRRGGFTERGAIAFLRAIQERSVAFRLINLSMDNLGSEGVQEIARVIKNPCVQLRRLQMLTESRIDRSVAFDANCRCLSLLASNNTLKILTLPLSFDRFSSEELDRLAGIAVGALQQNHTFRFIAPLTFDGSSAAQREAKRLLKANRKGPVAAPVLKGQPLHTKFISDMSDSVLPSAVARCNKLAKLDLVYAFVRQMNDAMVLRMDTGSGGKRKAG